MFSIVSHGGLASTEVQLCLHNLICDELNFETIIVPFPPNTIPFIGQRTKAGYIGIVIHGMKLILALFP